MSIWSSIRSLLSLLPGVGEDEDEDEFAWFQLPNDLDDADAWDDYHRNHIAEGFSAPFSDRWSPMALLADVLRFHQLRRVLFVGSGISNEPRALEAAGFWVTSLEISPYATHLAENTKVGEEELQQYLRPEQLNEGGTMEFVVGNLMDENACPGPYDAIIEKRTLQLFLCHNKLDEAMEAVVSRLADRGVFYSHSHDNRWSPPDLFDALAENRPVRDFLCHKQPLNPPREWFVEHGWTIWREPKKDLNGRVAWVSTSTG